MAESFSVSAILTAYDKGFTSAMKQATKSTETLGSKFKSGLFMGVFQGIGQQAFSTITSEAKNLLSEIDSSNATWKTFEQNMKIVGTSDKDIGKAKKAMQEYAQKTIYSSSDMATTYAQLAAVGTKNVDKLVTGFGGLASAAENPKQAMKTLSTQATQMAAKPSVAWQDFKLMLEQTPAGIAAVARQMGMSTAELVSNVQDGEIATSDFFKAIEIVGNNPGFSKMATEAKTVGQAMDGLRETIGNKLGPAFNVLSDIGIKAVNKLADALDGIDAQKIAADVSGFVEKAKPYWESFKDTAIEVWGALKKVGQFFVDHADTISKLIPYLVKGLIAYKGFKLVTSLVPGMMKFTKSITSLASGGIKGLMGKLFGVAKGEEAAGNSAKMNAKNMIASAKAFALMGVGVLLIAAGFGILAYSAIQLANSGGLAIGVMAGLAVGLALLGFGMVAVLKTLAPMGAQLQPVAIAMLGMAAAVVLVAVGFGIMAFAAIKLAESGGAAIAVMFGMVGAMALLAVGAAALGTALTAGSGGFLAFGAAIIMVGVGAVLAAASLYILAGVLPTIVDYGFKGALAITALGLAMAVFGVGALVAGVACVALGVGLIAIGAGALVAAVGIMAFGVGMMVAMVGTLLMAASLTLVEKSMKGIAKNAKAAEKSLIHMEESISIVDEALKALGEMADKAINWLCNAFSKGVGDAKKAAKELSQGFTKSLESGLKGATPIAIACTLTVATTLKSGQASAFAAGAFIGIGFANGMLSQLSIIESAAARMVKAADKAVIAKAKIGSPSRLFRKEGQWSGKGYGLGFKDMFGFVEKQSQKLINIPTRRNNNLEYAFNGGISEDYDYSSKREYNITVVSELDGREIARGTAKYDEEEAEKRERRRNRKNGRV